MQKEPASEPTQAQSTHMETAPPPPSVPPTNFQTDCPKSYISFQHSTQGRKLAKRGERDGDKINIPGSL